MRGSIDCDRGGSSALAGSVMHRSAAVLFISCSLFLGAVVALAQSRPKAADVLRDLGFSADEIVSVNEGQLVSKMREATTERELGLAMAMVFEVRPPDLVDMFTRCGDYAYDPSVTAFGEIKGAGSLADFAKVALEPSQRHGVR